MYARAAALSSTLRSRPENLYQGTVVRCRARALTAVFRAAPGG